MKQMGDVDLIRSSSKLGFLYKVVLCTNKLQCQYNKYTV